MNHLVEIVETWQAAVNRLMQRNCMKFQHAPLSKSLVRKAEYCYWARNHS